MFWNRCEWGEWTFGFSIDHMFTLHIGPVKIGYVPKGTKFYDDLSRIRSQEGRSS